MKYLYTCCSIEFGFSRQVVFRDSFLLQPVIAISVGCWDCGLGNLAGAIFFQLYSLTVKVNGEPIGYLGS